MLWMAVLVPPMLRGRSSQRRSFNGTFDFKRQLGLLDPNRNRSASVTAIRPARATPIRRVPNPSPGHSLAAAPHPWFAMPPSLDAARRRRRDIIVAFAGLSVLTLVLAVAFGGPFLAAQLLSDLALLGYVMAVAQRQRLADERRDKVTPIRPPQVAAAAGGHRELLQRAAT